MPDSHSTQPDDELTPVLRKALVEIGALIPTTSEEVQLAEAHLGSEPTRAEVADAFENVQRLLHGKADSPAFMRLDESIVVSADNELAMAARNGTALDAETRAKIEQDVAAATRKPSQT